MYNSCDHQNYPFSPSKFQLTIRRSYPHKLNTLIKRKTFILLYSNSQNLEDFFFSCLEYILVSPSKSANKKKIINK